MQGTTANTEDLLRQAEQGSRQALGALFACYEKRLERMVRLRMDRRLQGRVDSADVLQDAYLAALEGFPRYVQKPGASFFLWLRGIVGHKLMDIHRHHLGALARDARREVSLSPRAGPPATSEAVAAELLARRTSPSEAASRAERRQRLEEVLDGMDPLDREVLVLRHLEQLTNAETAEALGIQESAASKRHLRALKRLRQMLKSP
ncbi:MAG: sigma-70 family RNA polymerase sigma factor [Planctomycetes bacterium]|nr:sigma-70 family RNA polymerase sigma factor [Planctomycetota bacterium]